MIERQERTFKKGEVIYRENDYESCMYDILYGAVALYQNYGTREQVLIKELNGDGYFGEIELVEARARTTTAVALEKTLVNVITADSFGAYFSEKPALVMEIMQQMAARIRELTREYLDACRVVSDAMAAEKAGQEKSESLQQERRALVDFYMNHFGG